MIASALASVALAPGCEAAQLVGSLAEIDPKTAGLIALVLRPILAIGQLLFVVRIVLTWYPLVSMSVQGPPAGVYASLRSLMLTKLHDGQENSRKLPWALAVLPTEPFLKPTRKVVPPLVGVDISPVVWVAILSFTNEILLGPQGILIMLQRKLEL